MFAFLHIDLQTFPTDFTRYLSLGSKIFILYWYMGFQGYLT